MNLIKKYGRYAFVAGAAEGLGKAFAAGLARRGFDLILIDHKAILLDQTAQSLRAQYNIETNTMILDLGDLANVEPIVEIMKEYDCRFLVYNAAYGPVKPFLSNSGREAEQYFKVNMEMPYHLVFRFIGLHQGKQSGVMLVSSLAGFRGTQFVTPYAATKAWTWNFAEGLYYEFRDAGFDISVCCPGATATPNFLSTNPRGSWMMPKPLSPEKVAEEALDSFGKKLFIIPGFSNKLSHFILTRLLPRGFASALQNATMKRMYDF